MRFTSVWGLLLVLGSATDTPNALAQLFVTDVTATDTIHGQKTEHVDVVNTDDRVLLSTFFILLCYLMCCTMARPLVHWPFHSSRTRGW